MNRRYDDNYFRVMTLFILLAILSIFFLLTCCSGVKKPIFAPQKIIEIVNAHTVAIAVYYYMDEAEFNRRMAIKNDNEPSYLQTVAVLDNSTVMLPDGKPAKLMAYIGAGTILPDNYILSVSHLFENDENTVAVSIWVFQKNADHGIKAHVVAISEGEDRPFYDDYAVLKLEEDLGMPGLEIAETKDFSVGHGVMFTGSVDAYAFLSRFSRLVALHKFFRITELKKLELTMWAPFPFLCVYPSGGGDSGGNICTSRGKIITAMYAGISIYGTLVVFGNPNEMLWQFLKDNELEWLGK